MKIYNIEYQYKSFGMKQKQNTLMLGVDVADVKRKLKDKLSQNNYVADVKVLSCKVNKDNSKVPFWLGNNRKRKFYYTADSLIWKRRIGSCL